jgi:hypothetical protein
MRLVGSNPTPAAQRCGNPHVYEESRCLRPRSRGPRRLAGARRWNAKTGSQLAARTHHDGSRMVRSGGLGQDWATAKRAPRLPSTAGRCRATTAASAMLLGSSGGRRIGVGRGTGKRMTAASDASPCCRRRAPRPARHDIQSNQGAELPPPGVASGQRNRGCVRPSGNWADPPADYTRPQNRTST